MGNVDCIQSTVLDDREHVAVDKMTAVALWARGYRPPPTKEPQKRHGGIIDSSSAPSTPFVQSYEPDEADNLPVLLGSRTSQDGGRPAQMPRRLSDDDLEELRASFRFGLNDRVVCWCGPRWLSGHIVSTAVIDGDCVAPYRVKFDSIPELQSSTILVPCDTDEVCAQEICFCPLTQLDLVKACAVVFPEEDCQGDHGQGDGHCDGFGNIAIGHYLAPDIRGCIPVPRRGRPKLRFSVGDAIVCRIQNSVEDDLEQWVPGRILETWPRLPGEETWDMGDIAGRYPSVVPYEIQLTLGRSRRIYCHRDAHTLIRREGMKPRTRVRGISKRFEVRQAADGSFERVDHLTERRKPLQSADPSDSDTSDSESGSDT